LRLFIQVATLSAQTGLSADKIKLIYNGGVMKNMSLPLAGYGLKDGSMIVLVGSNDPPASGVMGAVREQQVKKKKEEIPTTEDGLVEFLAGKRRFVEEMKPELDTFEKDCQTYLSASQAGAEEQSSASVPTWQKLQQAHARITEILLQHLLKLDGIEIQSSMSRARAERKEAVRVVQREMDSADAVWAKVRDQKS
jgi:hypothetical protein